MRTEKDGKIIMVLDIDDFKNQYQKDIEKYNRSHFSGKEVGRNNKVTTEKMLEYLADGNYKLDNREEIADKIEILTGEIEEIEYTHKDAPECGMIDMGKFQEGSPDYWIEQTEQAPKQFANIFISMSSHCNVDVNNFENWGIAVMSYLEYLNKQNINYKVFACAYTGKFTSECKDTYIALEMPPLTIGLYQMVFGCIDYFGRLVLSYLHVETGFRNGYPKNITENKDFILKAHGLTDQDPIKFIDSPRNHDVLTSAEWLKQINQK